MGGATRVSGSKWPAWMVAAAGGLALVAGCKHLDPEVAAPPVVRVDGGPSDRLEAGRAVYLGESKCARCHRPKPVADYAADEWTGRILPKMAGKARLTQQEYTDVQSYILAAASARSPD